MATFVLVHGAFHGGWCWERVVPRLSAAGHAAHAPTLAGLGARAAEPGPAIDLEMHVRDVTGLLERHDLRDVVLVGHSYGGIVITAAADRLPERLVRLGNSFALVPRRASDSGSVGAVEQCFAVTMAHACGCKVAV